MTQTYWNQQLEEWVKDYYFPAKNALSLVMDLGNQTRRPLPILGKARQDGSPSLELCNAVNAHLGKLEYHLDPMGGALDHYTHPEIVQAMLETGKYPRPCDCDEFGLKGKVQFRVAGVKSEYAWMWTMVINAGDQWHQMDKNHVVCGIRYMDVKGEWTGVLDTNSAYHKKILWIHGTADSQDTQDKILEHFSNIYSCNYALLLKTPDPWYGL